MAIALLLLTLLVLGAYLRFSGQDSLAPPPRSPEVDIDELASARWRTLS
jgi:hypothetical protein